MSPGHDVPPVDPLTPREIAMLCDHGWVDAADSLMRTRQATGLGDAAEHRAGSLAKIVRRVLTLDAEDFEVMAEHVPPRFRQSLIDAGFPHEPRAEHRGALGSLVPLYEVMLEVLDVRMMREEPQHVVVTAHIIGEYLEQLAWEPVLGDGGDPITLPSVVGEKWGGDGHDCAHTSAMNATAHRSLNAASGDVTGYTAYLDKFHSRLGEALGVCAMNHATIGVGERPDVGITCPHPCAWVLQGSRAQRRALDARVRLARMYQESSLVALRHHAPVGHFFGVPSAQEISAAWIDTWNKLNEQWADGCNPLLDEDAPGWGVQAPQEALPGLSRLVSVIACRPVKAGHLFADLSAAVIDELDGDQAD